MNKNTITILFVLFLATGTFWAWTNDWSGADKATGNAIVGVRVPDLSSVTKVGMELFNSNCATCHGANAAGRDGIAPPLVHKIYEPSHHGDQAFILAAKNGVRSHHWPFGDMPPVTGASQNEVRKIVAYVRALQRANGIN